MLDLGKLEVWFVTGSQHLYGTAILKTVAEHSTEIARAVSQSSHVPVQVVVKPVLTTPDAIHGLCAEANNTKNCIGLIAWMHTFSPAKDVDRRVARFNQTLRPSAHPIQSPLPWSTIDMDFMNLNQSAHGDREFGFLDRGMRLTAR